MSDGSAIDAPYETWPDLQSAQSGVMRMAAIAKGLRTNGQACRLSPLVAMTDPARTPDLLELPNILPIGSAIILRHFGQAETIMQARDLRALTQARGQQLLIGQDIELALEIGADGVHFPRDTTLAGPIQLRDTHPGLIITMAGLKDGDYLEPLSSLDALFLSSVFPSRSPSAGSPMGVETFKHRVADLAVAVYALGGVNATTALDLIHSGAAGLASIGGFIMDVKKQATDRGHRFVIETEAGEAELTLVKVRGGVFNANHTFTPTALRGQGVAGKLYDAMIADAKIQGYKIIPGCPYVEVKFRRNPEDKAAVGA